MKRHTFLTRSIFTRRCAIVIALLATCAAFAADTPKPLFNTKQRKAWVAQLAKTAEAAVFTDPVSKSAMRYRLLLPPGYDKKKTYPLVLCLHGSGGRGNDNVQNMAGSEAFLVLAKPENRSAHPAILLAPQCPDDLRWVDIGWNHGSYSTDTVKETEQLKSVVRLLDAVIAEHAVDKDRVYVAGASMGGYGAWDVLIRHSDRFAAGMAICGAGDPAKARQLAKIPVWVAHGDADKTVPVSGSRDMVAAIKKAGGEVRYFEYPGVEHESWAIAFAEPGWIEWLLSKRRAGGRPR